MTKQKQKGKVVETVTPEDYGKIIAIMNEGLFDKAGLSVKLASKYPLIFLELVKDSWVEDVRRNTYTNTGSKIACIKECRRLTGKGLKEAKEAVEHHFIF